MIDGDKEYQNDSMPSEGTLRQEESLFGNAITTLVSLLEVRAVIYRQLFWLLLSGHAMIMAFNVLQFKVTD